jgi:hypothetical protein
MPQVTQPESKYIRHLARFWELSGPEHRRMKRLAAGNT